MHESELFSHAAMHVLPSFTCTNPFADQCPSNHEVVFIYLENAVITPLSLRDPETDEVIGEQFEYKCELDYILEISHDGEFSFNKPVPPKASIKYECTYKEGSYQSSIDKYGIPRCKLSKICTCD